MTEDGYRRTDDPVEERIPWGRLMQRPEYGCPKSEI